MANAHAKDGGKLVIHTEMDTGYAVKNGEKRIRLELEIPTDGLKRQDWLDYDKKINRSKIKKFVQRELASFGKTKGVFRLLAFYFDRDSQCMFAELCEIEKRTYSEDVNYKQEKLSEKFPFPA